MYSLDTCAQHQQQHGSVEWIEVRFALNNNLRINKFRAKVSTYYLRICTLIKCSNIIISSGSSEMQRQRHSATALPHHKWAKKVLKAQKHPEHFFCLLAISVSCVQLLRWSLCRLFDSPPCRYCVTYARALALFAIPFDLLCIHAVHIRIVDVLLQVV